MSGVIVLLVLVGIGLLVALVGAHEELGRTRRELEWYRRELSRERSKPPVILRQPPALRVVSRR